VSRDDPTPEPASDPTSGLGDLAGEDEQAGQDELAWQDELGAEDEQAGQDEQAGLGDLAWQDELGGGDEAGGQGELVGQDEVGQGAWLGPEDGYEAAEAPPGQLEDGSHDEGYEEGEGYDRTVPGPAPVYRAPPPHRLLKVVGAVVAVLLVAGFLGFVHISHEVNPPGPPGRTVTVTVPAGASTLRIADLLAKAGVIHGPTVFELYVKLEASGPLLPGTYHLATNEPYSRALAALEKGPVPVIEQLVVPEGYTIRQMAAALGRLKGTGVSSQAFVAAATGGQVRSPYEPSGTKSLEGLLFPATYPVRQGEQADDLVQYMVDTFDYHAAQLGLEVAAERLHRSVYQIVIVASIVEREAKLDVDRGPIASAIYNRLAAGMPIGAESTLLYGLGDPKGAVEVTTRNPYNTLVNKGLPPTPIASPGIPSLRAALDPPHTDYLYWVEVKPDGKMGFASTPAGFAKLQQECGAAHLC
jgi:UPF0755 protein